MTVVPLTNDLASRVRAETSVPGRRAVIIVEDARDLAEQDDVARQLGISQRQLAKARRVVREEPNLARKIRTGEFSLDAAENLLRDRSMRSVGPEALARFESRIAAVSGQAPRRALELAAIEREAALSPRDVFTLAHRLSINNTAVRRARQAVASGHDDAVRAGTRSLTDAADTEKPVVVDAPIRIDASWVGREVSRKLETALEELSELPLAADVAVLLRERPNLTARLDRAVAWLKELRDAL